jgi:hypothetical protein
LDLGDDGVFVAYALGKTLTAEMTEFNLSHVQP